jgi:hypothetical protein
MLKKIEQTASQINVLNAARQVFWAFFVALAFFLFMYSLFPFQEIFEIDPDEGQNAMISLMINRGYSLYSEIWSDHPPLFPYLLDYWLRFFGYEIHTARIMVLLFSSILIGSAYQFLKTAWSTRHAIAGLILIVLLPYYSQLSVSLMIGLPAIALAMFALTGLQIWHKQRSYVWLIISATALVLSLYVKLFTLILVPIFMIGIYSDGRNERKRHTWHSLPRSLQIWLFAFVSFVLLIGLTLIGPGGIAQLVGFYMRSVQIESYLEAAKIYDINWFLRESLPLLVLASTGGIYTIVEKNWSSIYLVAWTVLAYLTLRWQIPVWYHHQLLITIPAAMLAGIAIGQSISTIQQLFKKKGGTILLYSLAIISMSMLILSLVMRIPETLRDFSAPDVLLERERMFLVRSSNHAAETKWFVTDTPMYAFQIKASVPPNLTVFSDKRILSGNLSEEHVLSAISEYQPEQVFFGRFNFPTVKEYIQEDYRLLYQRGKRSLYLRQE